MMRLEPKDKKALLRTALGLEQADLAVVNCRLVNVFTGEIYPAQVDILDGIVVRVREEGQDTICPSKEIYDGSGAYLIPGFIDVHMHVESTMMIPEQVSRAILPWGTTTICTDPHEIGNVMGIEGVEFMLENAKKIAASGMTELSIRIPVIPGFNDTPEEIRDIAVFTRELGHVKRLHLLPYHRLGQDKYDGLNRPYLMGEVKPPANEKMQMLLKVAEEFSGVECQIGG